MSRTLLLIAAFLTFMIGSFIWFVATWDAANEQPVGFFWPEKLPPEGPHAAGAPLQTDHLRGAT